MPWRRLHIYRRVVVNTRDGGAFEGVLWGRRGPLIILREAELVNRAERVRLDGEVIIERDHVNFMQVPPEHRVS